MARTSKRVSEKMFEYAKERVVGRGSAPKMSLEDLYYKTEDILTTICDISRQYKSLGWNWYCSVRDGLYATAINSLSNNHRYDYDDVKCLVEELRDLRAEINHIEKGGDR